MLTSPKKMEHYKKWKIKTNIKIFESIHKNGNKNYKIW